jgi:Tfp pilus assembly protein PilN
MRALHLDFLELDAPRTRLGIALLAAGVLAVALLGWRHQTLAAELQSLDSRLADVKQLARREMPRVRGSAGDPKIVAQEVSRANAVLASLTLPWDALFGELEAAATQHVALLAIQPDGGGKQVRIGGEARRFEDLLAYIARLEGTAGFANVFLAAHELKTGGKERGVTFSLIADWEGRP